MDSSERYEDMLTLYSEGHTLQAIGDKYGITKERVRQILSKQNARYVTVQARRRAQQRTARLANLVMKRCRVCDKEFSCVPYFVCCSPQCTEVNKRWPYAFNIDHYRAQRLREGLGEVPNRIFLYPDSELLYMLTEILGTEDAARSRLLSIRQALLEG